MTQAGTKTVRNIAKSLGISTSNSWTDAPYVNTTDRALSFAVNSTNGAQLAEDLNAALFEAGLEGTTASYTNTSGWGYVRVKRATIEV